MNRYIVLVHKQQKIIKILICFSYRSNLDIFWLGDVCNYLSFVINDFRNYIINRRVKISNANYVGCSGYPYSVSKIIYMKDNNIVYHKDLASFFVSLTIVVSSIKISL